MKQSGNLGYYRKRFFRSPGMCRIIKWAEYVATYGDNECIRCTKLHAKTSRKASLRRRRSKFGVDGTCLLGKQAASMENESNRLRIYPVAGCWY